MISIKGVARKCTTQNRTDEQDMPHHRVQADKVVRQNQTGREGIQEEYTREVMNHIETGKRRIWHKVPLQVFKVHPPPTVGTKMSMTQDWQEIPVRQRHSIF